MIKTCTLAIGLALAFPAAAVDLRTALRSAEQNDPALASASAQRDAAAENIAIARARLLPQVSLQASRQRLEQTTTSGTQTREFEGPSSNTQLNVRQGVFRPRDWLGVDVGKLQAEYGQYKLYSAQGDLWLRTVSAWIDVLGAQAVREFQAQSVDSAVNAATQEKRRFQSGEGTRDAVAEGEAVLALARAQLASAELELAARGKAFALLTRIDPQSLRSLKLPELRSLPASLPAQGDVLQLVLETNPELLAARAAEAITQKRLAQAKVDHLPTFDLVGSRARAENDTVNTIGTRYNNTQLGFQLTVPIYSGGGLSATQRQQAALLTAAQADRDAVEYQLRAQVSTEWNAQAGLRERAYAAQQLIGAAREQRKAAELGMRLGLRTWSDASAADLSIGRRGADYVAFVVALVKAQAKLLSLLPVTDPVWDRWAQELSAGARP